MYFPMLFYFLSQKQHLAVRFFTILMIIIFIIGGIFSYTRAAWVSFASSCGGHVDLYKLKIRFSVLASMGLSRWVCFDQFMECFGDATREETVRIPPETYLNTFNPFQIFHPMHPILERINRWECAIEMFKEKPMFGWGPGTYMFQYAPFQRSSSLTIISTNNADNGNAHSEYIGPLAEAGVLGSLTFIAISGSGLLLWFNTLSQTAGW